MRSLRSSVLLASLLVAAAPFAVGCTAPGGDDGASADSDLTTNELVETCSPPVRSADGAYVLVDQCPKNGEKGRILRRTIATGETKEVAQYAPEDRVAQLSAAGSRFFYSIRHAVDRVGLATAGVEVSVRDFALTEERTLAATPPPGVTGSLRALETLMLSADGSHVAWSSRAEAGDAELSSYLFVAPVTGDAGPVALDLGIPSAALRWSIAGSSLVGHADAPAGETLVLVDVGGPEVATLAAKRDVSLVSFELGQGGIRPQEPFDGARVVGFKSAEGRQSVGTVDPRTGEEKELASAPLLSIVTDLGPDILYASVVEAEGGYERRLVKQPRDGSGAPTTLVKTAAATLDDLRYGFEPLAVSVTGKFGVFATRTGVAGVTERFVAALDGSSEERLADELRFVEQVGDRVLFERDVDRNIVAFEVLDLVTGALTTLGETKRSPAFFVGDGTVVQFERCQTESGSPGTSVRHTTPSGATSSPCAWMPWASSTPLAVPGSDALVFYASSGPFPNYRYDIGVVRP